MKPELKAIIQKDIYRYYGKKEIPFKEKILPYNMGLKYIILFRKAQFYFGKRCLAKYFYQYKLKRLSLKLGFQIHPSTQIGEGFYLGHIGNTVINPSAVLGKNISLEQGVTIGADFRGKRAGCPIIGDDVFIGANAVIVGKVTVGNDVVIAPNAFLNSDVPDHSVVIGNPAKIIAKENASKGFLVYRV